MRIKFANLRFMLVIATVTALGSSSLVCQAQEKLPTAEEVIAKYVEVTGGLEKYKSIKSMHQSGTMSIPVAGIEGTIDLKTIAPNKLAVSVELAGAGNEMSGSNGETVWSSSTMTGDRILTGKEAEQTLLEADLRRIYDPASVYKLMEVIGIEEVDGDKCYKLKVTRKSGEEQLEYYSIDTGLQTQSKITAQSPMGPVKIEVGVSDYQDVGGLKFPHKMTQTFVDQGMVIEVVMDKIELNPEFPADTFDLPENIQKIAAKKSEKAAADDEDEDEDEDDDEDDDDDDDDDDGADLS